MSRKLLLALIPVCTLVGPPLALSAYKWWSNGGASRLPLVSLAMESKAAANSSPAAPGLVSPAATPEISVPPGGPAAGAVPNVPAAPALRLEGDPASDLAEVFRFDVTPGWIMARWPRVSTGLPEIPLQGYRVPLVTGTAEDDLAGALTYYFNPHQQVQRIRFQGTTGDARKVTQFLVARYRFGRRLTNDPRLFRYEVAEPNGRSRSVLDIRPAEVVKSAVPRHRFDIALTIERPAE